MNIFSVFSLYSSLEFRLLNGKEAYFIDFMWFTFYAKSDLSTSDTYFYLLALPKYQMSEASNWNQTWRILNLHDPQKKPWIHTNLFNFHFRTANAADSSQMREVMWSPPSPESNREEVVEEPCIAIGMIFFDFPKTIGYFWNFHIFSDCADKKAIPFFTHESGAILIKGGTVVNDDKMEVADVIVEDGKIAQVGEDLEVPSGAKIIDATDKFVMPGM